STSKPKNFSDDFLLTTLGSMFEKPDGQTQVWKNQRTIHGQAKVKIWKLLESCVVVATVVIVAAVVVESLVRLAKTKLRLLMISAATETGMKK
nr:hypothetical protein [Tanacetum cinerariifolium]